jgi:2-oxoisovalerate dehydrogenase E2 component (dihydrolipoyl transacylase)
MGRYTFRLPDIGEGIAEAEIVAWHVKIGDRVEEDGRLADMMTDKATVEMESPVAGTVVELAGDVGDVVAIRSPLVVLEVEGEGEEADPGPSTGSGPGWSVAESQEPEAKPVSSPVQSSANKPKRAPAEPVEARAPTSAPSAKVLASPAVRARARNLGIDLAAVPTASDGRIHHAELDAHLAARSPASVDKSAQKPVEMLSGAGEQIKVVGLRRRIADAMAASKRHIPHFSYIEECDVTALEDLRAELNEMRALRQAQDDRKLSVLPLIIRAICQALPLFPMINARFDDAAGVVTRYTSVHLGVAVQTPAGLVVPVVRDAQALGLWDLAAEIARLADAARDGSATSAELSGSTLTVTSLGPLGGIATTPVINRPEVTIIGPNRIVERPVFMPDGQGGERLEKRKLMNVSISCDHRVVDGWDAASYVQAVKARLERPLMLLAG